MADDPEVIVTDVEIRALAAKLKGLCSLLTPAEQALLRAVLRRAARGIPGVADAAGVARAEEGAWPVAFNPFPYLDAIAAEEIRKQPRLAPDGEPP